MTDFEEEALALAAENIRGNAHHVKGGIEWLCSPAQVANAQRNRVAKLDCIRLEWGKDLPAFAAACGRLTWDRIIASDVMYAFAACLALVL
jgi:hypothetical protein